MAPSSHEKVTGSSLASGALNRPLVAILDDDEVMLQVLKLQLERRRFRCVAFSRTEAFLQYLETGERAALYIIDYFLDSHRLSGLDICRKIKSQYRAPVIMLTANKGTSTIVNCLQAGADQYIVKPYHIDELEARMQATMRLYETQQEAANVTSAAERLRECVTVNWLLRVISVPDGSFVRLTEKEMALFELLASEDGPLDRERAYASIYGAAMTPFNRSIDILVSRLRKKLGELQAGIDILTVRGGGYILAVPEREHGVA